MTTTLRVLARLDGGWPVWRVVDGHSEALATVIGSWGDLEALVHADDSADLDLTFGEDALAEMLSALGEPPWTIPGVAS